MISVRPAGRASVCGKKINIAIFLDTINMMNVKLCTMVVLIELYLFSTLLVKLTALEDQSSIKQFELKI